MENFANEINESSPIKDYHNLISNILVGQYIIKQKNVLKLNIEKIFEYS